ncbi:MAG: YifB family Mg chelatase-like AAA ATPase [Propionibacteriaceae bacterium]|jgi:magnesium chelatase family protein|nr:YifB family Mg chelatase-like AAA ATPase [Propionibacteriaceae bacterium]
MTIARAWSVALVGMEGAMVEVEVAIGSGLPKTVLVGLPDASLAEAAHRCKAAMCSARYGWPTDPVTINLSPATLPKAGSHYDLAIAAGMGAALGLCPAASLESRALFGELGLDGRVRPVRGLLPALLAASKHGFTTVTVPAAQMAEAALVEGLDITGVDDLPSLFDVLRGGPGVPAAVAAKAAVAASKPKDWADVVGQLEAKWALEVAAAGRHHAFLHGPPGVGKTLLAERLPGIAPDLSPDESLEVSAVHSLLGESLDEGLIRRPPYADPHHSASVASLVGGGARVARPGAVSRAHRGVLFLDEAPEFSPKALECLRVPLESGRVVLARAAATAVYPASFQLVMAANPCPCGLSSGTAGACKCSPLAVRRYRERISGPILDRIDIHQQLRPMRTALLKAALARVEPTEVVAARVLEARRRQERRLSAQGWRFNAEVPGVAMRRSLPLPDGIELLDEAVNRGQLSARGVDKVLRLAWTIADLAGASRPDSEHLHQALGLRRGEERGRN